MRSLSMGDLMKLSRRNVYVHQCLTAWHCGEFHSLEQCLIAMAVHLANENERLTADAVKRVFAEPQATLVNTSTSR